MSIYANAEIHDAVYRGRGKDYAAEAETVVKHVIERNPAAKSLLDVACGTGPHLEHFAATFGHVEGVDLAEDMIAFARKRLPDVPFHQGDMRELDLGRTFDVVTCMFSSVAYTSGTDELDSTIARFARHLNPGGVLVVEAWWLPEQFTPGYVAGDVVQVDGRTIARVSHSTEQDGATRIEEHFVVASPAEGVRHFSDVHLFRLFERQDYEAAFRRAGLEPEYVKTETGPGLFIGVAS